MIGGNPGIAQDKDLAGRGIAARQVIEIMGVHHSRSQFPFCITQIELLAMRRDS
jgi:hypothetical protein